MLSDASWGPCLYPSDVLPVQYSLEGRKEYILSRNLGRSLVGLSFRTSVGPHGATGAGVLRTALSDARRTNTVGSVRPVAQHSATMDELPPSGAVHVSCVSSVMSLAVVADAMVSPASNVDIDVGSDAGVRARQRTSAGRPQQCHQRVFRSNHTKQWYRCGVCYRFTCQSLRRAAGGNRDAVATLICDREKIRVLSGLALGDNATAAALWVFPLEPSVFVHASGDDFVTGTERP